VLNFHGAAPSDLTRSARNAVSSIAGSLGSENP
jgi:hypothetical protein